MFAGKELDFDLCVEAHWAFIAIVAQFLLLLLLALRPLLVLLFWGLCPFSSDFRRTLIRFSYTSSFQAWRRISQAFSSWAFARPAAAAALASAFAS